VALKHFVPSSGGAFLGVRPLAFGDNLAKWNLAWALHAGVAYNVSPNFTVQLAYRYVNMGDGLTGDLRSFDGTNSTVNPTTFKNISSHDLMLGVRWNLDNPPMYEPPSIRNG
jgi:opacity protein-like surface antigen